MQSGDPPEAGLSSLPKQDIDSPSAKRRRQSPRSAANRPEQSTGQTSAFQTSVPGQLTHIGPQDHGSFRQGDRDEMQRSSTPPEGSSVRYTRTGRVSKATKGQRVHRCDECDKTYTRAEHLRRHKQNHKPGAFVCDIPGCGRSFYREDLLTRHKERHNDPLDPPTRRTSIGSHISATGQDGSPFASASRIPSSNIVDTDGGHVLDDFAQSAPVTAPSQQATSRAPRKYIPIHELHSVASSNIPVDGGNFVTNGTSGSFFEPSPPYSPTGYASPTNDYTDAGCWPYYTHAPLGRNGHNIQSSISNTYEPATASRSPISAGSSTTFLPYWGQYAPSPSAAFNLNSSSSSDIAGSNSFDDCGPVIDESSIPIWTNGVLRLMPAQERDDMERNSLFINSASWTNLNGLLPYNAASNDDQRYVDAYFTWVHPSYPVLHKASFDLTSTSPLLRASVLALGMHALPNATDMNNAKTIHERAEKVIKKRTQQNWHTYRLCDMQALFLHELYAIFRSRRPPLQFSKAFENVYQRLVHDPEALGLNMGTSLFDSPISTRHAFEEVNVCDDATHDVQSKQYLLAACYILDQQHSLLFGRPAMQCMANANNSLTGLTLPFPRAQPNDVEQETYQDPFSKYDPSFGQCEQVYEALSTAASIATPPDQRHDAFQSMLLLACSIDPANNVQSYGLQIDERNDPTTLLLSLEQVPRTQLAYHTFMLCRHTPVRDLLAVAGESWVMAEKMGSQAQYMASQMVARSWASRTAGEHCNIMNRMPIQLAYFHALQILQLSAKHANTGLIFHDWSIYLAAVVVWAAAYIAHERPGRKPRLSIPSPTVPQLSAFELEKSVKAILAAGPQAVVGRKEAKHVLLWVKSRIEKVDVPHVCGLTNGALDVLGKLVTRGDEDGWFA
ncbi:hypothetical protein LTR78_001412 [Recurvomyces mirabilis]|uniref:C2H2-type domain-containing protein n=1 Tax=Recurvomyces mirabilis TaxID=574656 RepID=A0AAE1C5K9_9PEZI|nr:hypothetical protein LTR78_001412 [Recurvomyces mirabilis]KAK5161389.1 hypothetical protein LTS14_001185 [Recurvomyces mirabilis]